MATKQDLLVRLGAEIAEYVIANRGKEPALYAGALRQLQMFRDAIEYTPLTSSQVNALYDDNAALALMIEFKAMWNIEGETADAYFEAARRFVEHTYAENRMNALRGVLAKSYDKYLEEIKALPVDQIIERAGEIATHAAVAEHFKNIDGGNFDSEDIEALLTLDDPLKCISDSWPAGDSEDVDGMLFDMAFDRKGELKDSRREHTDNPYVILYRQNHLAPKHDTPAVAVADHLEKLKKTVEADYQAAVQPGADPTYASHAEDARAAFYDHFPSPVEVEVLLTYAHPLQEIIQYKHLNGVDFAAAVVSVIETRQAEMNGYLARLDQLPEFLQGPVREFQARCEAAQLVCAAISRGPGEDADYEPER